MPKSVKFAILVILLMVSTMGITSAQRLGEIPAYRYSYEVISDPSGLWNSVLVTALYNPGQEVSKTLSLEGYSSYSYGGKRYGSWVRGYTSPAVFGTAVNGLPPSSMPMKLVARFDYLLTGTYRLSDGLYTTAVVVGEPSLSDTPSFKGNSHLVSSRIVDDKMYLEVSTTTHPTQVILYQPAGTQVAYMLNNELLLIGGTCVVTVDLKMTGGQKVTVVVSDLITGQSETKMLSTVNLYAGE